MKRNSTSLHLLLWILALIFSFGIHKVNGQTNDPKFNVTVPSINDNGFAKKVKSINDHGFQDGLNNSTVGSNWADSVKKYTEIGLFYYETNFDSTTNRRLMKLADKYLNLADFYSRKTDSIANIAKNAFLLQQFSRDKRQLETKYHIILP